MPANHLSSIDIPLRLNAPAVFCTQHLAVTLFIYSDLGTAVRENPRRFSPPFHHRKGATLQKPAPKRSNAAVTFGKRRGCALPANSFDPAIRAETPESIRVILIREKIRKPQMHLQVFTHFSRFITNHKEGRVLLIVMWFACHHHAGRNWC
ncbi:hypothetical protein CIHG_01815 [Coccidioides immitis H538.4]|uniref:Uncharacterized protein n=1 Tax=Coccidioides immitis H538.4 TaxID=396776 RepID=A0A0J8RHC3_COCIT|nr:hypothetical protein CIHG_01815 [Coccidioides immitis H538.4]